MKKLDFVATDINLYGMHKKITYESDDISKILINFITDFDKLSNYQSNINDVNVDYKIYYYLSELNDKDETKDYYDDNAPALDAVLGIETSLVGLDSIAESSSIDLTNEAADCVPKLKAIRNSLLFPLVKKFPEFAEDLLKAIIGYSSYLFYYDDSESDNS